MNYQVNLLKDNNNPGAQPLLAFTHSSDFLAHATASSGGGLFGVFHGLFGLASNEVYVVLFSAGPCTGLAEVVRAAGFSLCEATDLVPTVRPLQHSPRTFKRSKPGHHQSEPAELLRLQPHALYDPEGSVPHSSEAGWARPFSLRPGGLPAVLC